VEFLLEGRPMVALVAVLLTTGGHTMNLREMGVSQGWVAAEVYALQSCYLVSLALTMLACPSLDRFWRPRYLTQVGLVLAVIGAVLNVLNVWAPLAGYLVARVAAGAGAGLVIFCAPLLMDARWRVPVTWAIILCPVIGPGVISIATMFYESSDWQHGFLFEGGSAALGLIALLTITKPYRVVPRPPRGTLTYLPTLVLASGALLYALHWGQLHGWLESPDIVVATVVSAASFAVTLGLVWRQLDWGVLGRNWVRFALFFFGGMCQFFHGYIMNIYGGIIVNLSSWQRAWLIWPLPIGMAAALIVGAVIFPRLRLRRGRALLALPGAILGLLLLSTGLYLCYQQMMEWPYWEVRDVIDLNWFPAPGQWELAPARFLMGLGIGAFMVAMDTQFNPDESREEMVRPFLNVAQFYGGGIAAVVLINFLIIGHKIHYSYSADRSTIQAEELSRREDLLRENLRKVGQKFPTRSSELLLYRFINYEADNLVFATIYVAFFLASLALSIFFFGLWIWHRFRAIFIPPDPNEISPPRGPPARRAVKGSP
jgi:hypothetical protein